LVLRNQATGGASVELAFPIGQAASSTAAE
jgi:hypothetical protein